MNTIINHIMNAWERRHTLMIRSESVSMAMSMLMRTSMLVPR